MISVTQQSISAGRAGPRRVRIVLGTLMLAALAVLASAHPARAQQIDPTTLPRLACGSPSSGNFDYWCGLWSTDPPAPAAGASVPAVPPLGIVSLERVSPGDVIPLDGRDFGAFSFQLQGCTAASLFYAGSYADGKVLACATTGGSRLRGYFRGDTGRSGSLEISTGTSTARVFQGEIVQHFLASNAWSGHCVGGWCATTTPPATIPSPTPTPAPTPSPSRPPAGPLGLRPMPPGVRDSTDSATLVGGISALIACASAVAFPASAGVTGPLCAGFVIGTTAGAATLGVDSYLRRRQGRSQERGTAAATSIALPIARPLGGATVRPPCRSGLDHSTCRRLAAAWRRYATDLGVAASLWEAMGMASDRLADAIDRGAGAGQVSQWAAAKAYAGALVDALDRQNRSGAALARLLRSTASDYRPSAARVTFTARNLDRLLPRSTVARLGRNGFEPADIRSGLARITLRRGAGLSLADVLARPVPTAGLRAFHSSITVPELTALVDALAAQRAIPPATASRLHADLVTLGGASAPGRTAAARRFIADADASGRFGLLLAVAARPLAD